MPPGEGDKESGGAGAGAGKAGGRRSPSPPRRGKGGAGGLGNHPVQLVPPSVLAANSKEAAEMEAGKGPVTAVDMSEVRRNEKGGVLVTPEELRVAFELLDTEKMGSVTLAALRKRLGFFFPDMTPKEYRFLMNNRKEITLTDLEELLVDNEITNFDPVAEAFKLYDPDGDGSIPGARLREVFAAYGFGEMSEDEYKVLLRTADIDGDGRISLADFRSMLERPVAPV